MLPILISGGLVSIWYWDIFSFCDSDLTPSSALYHLYYSAFEYAFYRINTSGGPLVTATSRRSILFDLRRRLQDQSSDSVPIYI